VTEEAREAQDTKPEAPAPPPSAVWNDQDIATFQEEMYQEFVVRMKVVIDEMMARCDGDGGKAFLLLGVLHAVHATEVGRIEKTLEDASSSNGIPLPDLVKERRTRMAKGRGYVAAAAASVAARRP
jgi:hypothetical protein